MTDLLPEGTTLEFNAENTKLRLSVCGEELTKEDFEVAIKSISNCTYTLNVEGAKFALYTSVLRKFSAIYDYMKERENE